MTKNIEAMLQLLKIKFESKCIKMHNEQPCDDGNDSDEDCFCGHHCNFNDDCSFYKKYKISEKHVLDYYNHEKSFSVPIAKIESMIKKSLDDLC